MGKQKLKESFDIVNMVRTNRAMKTLMRLLTSREERQLIGFQRSQCVIDNDRKGQSSDSSDDLSDGAILRKFKDEGHLENVRAR